MGSAAGGGAWTEAKGGSAAGNRTQIPGRGFGAQATPYAVTALPQLTPPVRPTCSPGYQGPQPPPHGFTASYPPAHPAVRVCKFSQEVPPTPRRDWSSAQQFSIITGPLRRRTAYPLKVFASTG